MVGHQWLVLMESCAMGAVHLLTTTHQGVTMGAHHDTTTEVVSFLLLRKVPSGKEGNLGSSQGCTAFLSTFRLYHPECCLCSKKYVGKTVQRLTERMNRHRNKFYECLTSKRELSQNHTDLWKKCNQKLLFWDDLMYVLNHQKKVANPKSWGKKLQPILRRLLK